MNDDKDEFVSGLRSLGLRPIREVQAEQDFNEGAKIGCMYAKDWYSLICYFSDGQKRQGITGPIGYRLISLMDNATGHVFHFSHLTKHPGALTASEVIPIFEEAFAKFGKPYVGVVVSHSSHLSSSELFRDEVTHWQGKFLKSKGITFPEMHKEERALISKWAADNGLHLEFDADKIVDQVKYPGR